MGLAGRRGDQDVASRLTHGARVRLCRANAAHRRLQVGQGDGDLHGADTVLAPPVAEQAGGGLNQRAVKRKEILPHDQQFLEPIDDRGRITVQGQLRHQADETRMQLRLGVPLIAQGGQGRLAAHKLHVPIAEETKGPRVMIDQLDMAVAGVVANRIPDLGDALGRSLQPLKELIIRIEQHARDAEPAIARLGPGQETLKPRRR